MGRRLRRARRRARLWRDVQNRLLYGGEHTRVLGRHGGVLRVREKRRLLQHGVGLVLCASRELDGGRKRVRNMQLESTGSMARAGQYGRRAWWLLSVLILGCGSTDDMATSAHTSARASDSGTPDSATSGSSGGADAAVGSGGATTGSGGSSGGPANGGASNGGTSNGGAGAAGTGGSAGGSAGTGAGGARPDGGSTGGTRSGGTGGRPKTSDAGMETGGSAARGGAAGDGGVTVTRCASDADCSSPDRFCDLATGTCVACLGNNHCKTGQTCVLSTHQCEYACRTSADCSDPVPYCDTTAKKCVACLGDANCTANGQNICDPATHTCVECVANSDCSCLLPLQLPCCTQTLTCTCSLLVCP